MGVSSGNVNNSFAYVNCVVFTSTVDADNPSSFPEVLRLASLEDSLSNILGSLDLLSIEGVASLQAGLFITGVSGSLSTGDCCLVLSNGLLHSSGVQFGSEWYYWYVVE